MDEDPNANLNENEEEGVEQGQLLEDQLVDNNEQEEQFDQQEQEGNDQGEEGEEGQIEQGEEGQIEQGEEGQIEQGEEGEQGQIEQGEEGEQEQNEQGEIQEQNQNEQGEIQEQNQNEQAEQENANNNEGQQNDNDNNDNNINDNKINEESENNKQEQQPGNVEDENLLNEVDPVLDVEEMDYENMDEDLYMQELRTKLRQMQKERKEAENDAMLLDNRLNLLKGEEKKTLKKIEKTKKTANNKLSHIQYVVERARQKEELKRKKEFEIEQKKINNQKMKNKIKENIENKKLELQRQIAEEAKLIKLQKEYNQQLISYLKNENMNLNKNKCTNVKARIINDKEKKELLQHQRKLKIREELEKKLIEEYKLKEKAEAKKAMAEQEEMVIIQKLQTTTQLHKNITDELQNINVDNVISGMYNNSKDYSNYRKPKKEKKVFMQPEMKF